MKTKFVIAALATCAMMSGSALAYGGPRDHDRRASARGQSDVAAVARYRRGNFASTSTSGVAVTTRRGGSAAIDTRGIASGRGAVASSSEGEVFSSTSRDGSDADAWGRSDSAADEPNN